MHYIFISFQEKMGSFLKVWISAREMTPVKNTMPGEIGSYLN
jgi:hypothetical protein